MCLDTASGYSWDAPSRLSSKLSAVAFVHYCPWSLASLQCLSRILAACARCASTLTSFGLLLMVRLCWECSSIEGRLESAPTSLPLGDRSWINKFLHCHILGLHRKAIKCLEGHCNDSPFMVAIDVPLYWSHLSKKDPYLADMCGYCSLLNCSLWMHIRRTSGYENYAIWFSNF